MIILGPQTLRADEPVPTVSDDITTGGWDAASAMNPSEKKCFYGIMNAFLKGKWHICKDTGQPCRSQRPCGRAC